MQPAAVAPSGVWAVHWTTPTSLLIGTRKNGVLSLGQSWSFVQPAPPVVVPAEAKPAEEKPAEVKPDAAPPAAAPPAAEKPADTAPTAEKPAE